MSLWLPPKVAEAQHEERLAQSAEIAGLIEHDNAEARHWTRELRQIDPYLSVRYIQRPPHWDDSVEPPAGIVWSRWHVIRENPDAPPTFIPIVTESGGYWAPDSGG